MHTRARIHIYELHRQYRAVVKVILKQHVFIISNISEPSPSHSLTRHVGSLD